MGELVEIPVRSWLVLELVFVVLWFASWGVISTPAGDDDVNSDIGNAQLAWVAVVVSCGWLLTFVCNFVLRKLQHIVAMLTPKIIEQVRGAVAHARAVAVTSRSPHTTI